MTTITKQKQRSAAITGAGSGLGRDIALGLAAKGYRVFGTAMNPEEIADLKEASAGVVTLSHCDMTDWLRERLSDQSSSICKFNTQK